MTYELIIAERYLPDGRFLYVQKLPDGRGLLTICSAFDDIQRHWW